MLRLTHDQADVVEQLQLRRHAIGIGAALQSAWPAVSERLKDRWPAFVETALQQGHRHGIDEPADLARYASLWCIWGAGFEDKPGFEWAREVLADSRRIPALKVHQLLHRSRDELARQRPSGPSVLAVVDAAQFDAALAKVEAGMATQAIARAVFLDVRPAPTIQPCDVATVDLMVADIDNLLEYQLADGIWRRVAAPRLGAPPLRWTFAPDEPLPLAILSHALRAGPSARLNLKVEPAAVCDPHVHPEVQHLSEQGLLAWKGRDAARLSLALYARAQPLPDPKLGPFGIAAPTEADLQNVQISACGLRNAGAPFGRPEIELKIYPATQWLTEVRHAIGPTLSLPAPPIPPAATPAPVLKLEADGVARDGAAWQRGWAALQPQCRTGFEKLFNAFVRQIDNVSARLDAEVSPLVGQAALAWGWRRVAPDAVVMRSDGAIDLLVCALDLRLSGELQLGDARARITLASQGSSELRVRVQQLGDEAIDGGQTLAAAKRSWQFPFTLEFEPIASGALSVLSVVTPVAGALGAIAGEAGLRPRPDGKGLQWYFSLRAEPCAVVLQSADPVLGLTQQRRVLFPALPLVEWSAG